jgi:RHS repeat-associated protein
MDNPMFRNTTLQRAVSSILIASFASGLLAPLGALAQTRPPAMVGSVPLIPLQAPAMSGTPTLDANGIPTGKGLKKVAARAVPGVASATLAKPPTYGDAVGDLHEMARKSAADLRSGKGDALAMAKALRAQYGAVLKQESAMAASFAATATYLRANGVPDEIVQRNTAAASQFGDRSASLRKLMTVLDAAAAGKSSPREALGQVSKWLDQYPSVSGQQGHGKGALPWGQGQKAAPKVAQTERQHEARFPRSIELAANGTISGITLPDAILPDAVQPADLVASDDAPATPEIRALATSLGNNPVAISNWVRNQVRYTPGYGAMQGAAATLKSKRGNDVDTASLLIALYRAAGIPARYAYGTIEVPAARMQNWLGVDNTAAALVLLTQSGIPNRSAGQAVQLEHVWVEAYIDNSPSRGAVNKTASEWVPVDPSFKQIDKQAGMDLRTAISLNEAGLFDSVKQGATCTVDYARNLNVANLQQGFTGYKNLLDTYLTQQGSDVTVGQVLGSAAIAPENYGVLMGTLPYTLVARGTLANVLPDQLRWKFHLNLYADGTAQGQGESIAAFSSTLAEVANKRLTMSFVPATQGDANTLALYMPKAHADQSAVLANEFPTQVPGYLIRVKAEIRLDGAVVASGGSFVLGSDLVADIGAFDPSAGSWNNTTFGAHAGDYHAVAIDAQGVSAAQLNSLKSRMNSLQAKLAAGQTAALSRDDVSGELLYQGAMAYFGTADANAAVFQRAAGVVEQRLPSYGRAVAQVQPEMMLGIVGNVSFPGVVLDIDRASSAVASQSAGMDGATYVRQANERNAAYAHQVLARMFTNAKQPGMAVSPVRSLAAAATAGQTVYAVTNANSSIVLPKLTLSASAGADLQNDTAAGLRALVAQTPVSVGGWTGQGIATEDPTSGAGNFRLSGDMGGATAALYPTAGMGWLALAEPGLSAGMLAPVAQAGQAMDITLASMLDDAANTTRWSFFPGQAETVNGLFLARLAAAQGGHPCDSLAVIMAADLTAAAGFDKGSVAGAPVITSVPVIAASAGQGYSYPVIASDPQGGAIAYSLVGAPTGMSISDSGVISWLKPVGGSYSVTVRADNGKAFAEQRYQLGVSAQALALSATLVATPAVVNLGETVEIDFVTNGGTGNIALSLTVDGQAVAIDNMGHASVTALVKGAHQISGTATDSIGKVVRAATYSVRDLADSTLPVAIISGPTDDAEVTAPVNVTGTASATNMAYYQLLLRLSGNTAWNEIARGTSAVSNGVLGKLDPTQLANGIYELVLVVTDANGNKQNSFITVDIYRDLKIGQFAISFEDLNVEASGIPIRVTRTYDTRKKGESLDFGYGWTVDYQSVQLRKNMVLGLQWNVQVRQLLLCLVPSGKRKINIVLPDGSVQRFTAANSQECALGQVPSVDIRLSPLPGTTSTLEIINMPLVQARGGSLYDMENLEPWNPTEFKLTTEDDFVYYLTEGIGITSIKDASGNTLTYGQNGIVHSNGQSVAFIRDAAKRITAITDPAGKRIAYEYNAAGDLVKFTDRTDAITKLSYNRSHGLTDFTDPMGTVMARYVYDDDGRVLAVYDADGKAIESIHDTAGNKEIVKDRRGNLTTYTYDRAGNVTEVIDALNNTSKYSYDALGNATVKTDANGKSITSSFDPKSGKQLSETDAIGNVVRWTYDEATQSKLQKTTDARGNATNYFYFGNGSRAINEELGRATSVALNSSGQLAQLSVAGQVTKFTYDAKGNRSSAIDANGNVTTFTHDANGKETSSSWSRMVNGKLTTLSVTRTLDANGRVLTETDALGHTTSITYTAGSQVASTVDAQGRSTMYEYNNRGKLVKTRYPDGGVESVSYDANGNQASTIDRLGRTTAFEYDALNRLIKTIFPDGSVVAASYDAAGRVATTTDANGTITKNGYDDVGRLTSETGDDGKSTRSAYDANGNRTDVWDANGMHTQYVFDALNRLVTTNRGDGKSAKTVWNVNGTKQSDTDFAGNVTTYGYDAMARLNQVTQTNDAIAQVTIYGFDSQGNKTSQEDAEGHITRWEYDAANRVTVRILPGGQKEIYSYDAVGNLATKTDFNGKTTSYGYDTGYQQNLMVLPRGAAVMRTFTPSGLLASVTVRATQGSGLQNGTTTYVYDSQDRMIRQTNPNGSFISYAMDVSGNIVQRSTRAGTVSYSYDTNQRLVSVQDSAGKKTKYTYDAVGRMLTRALPNGVETAYGYDANGRLVQMLHTRSGAIITGVRYTLADNGQRNKVEEFDGASVLGAGGPTNAAKTRLYRYDGTRRITQEQALDRSGVIVRTTDYTYDKVGNRSRKIETTSGGTEIFTYVYDSNDRLTQETKATATGSSVLTGYSWDANGNLSTKTIGANVNVYVWNDDNRLVEVKQGSSVTTAQVRASYEYDVEGNRVKKTEPGRGGLPDTVTTFLVDSAFAYAQTVQENVIEGSRTATTNYVWGEGLVEQIRGDQTMFYHADGHGSVKTMSDLSGSAKDSYEYDAFGILESHTGATENGYRYTSEYFDSAIDLQFNRARWLDSSAGRFISQDVVTGVLAKPATLNKYVYADADPINVRDPSGKFGLGEVSAANSVASILNSVQIDIGTNLLDAALDPDAGESNVWLMGAAALGAVAGFKLLSRLSTKFRLKNLPVVNRVDMTHIIGAHVPIGATRKMITGYHMRPGGIDASGFTIRILRGPNKKGVYEGEVFFNGVRKKDKALSTFFPDHWDQQRVETEVLAAYMSGKGPGGGTLWEGVSSGVKIQGRLEGGVITTAYPVF